MPLKPVDLTALTDELTAIEGEVPTIVKLLSAQGAAIQAAVQAALEADSNANNQTIDSVNAAISGVTTRFHASAAAIADAIAANPGPGTGANIPGSPNFDPNAPRGPVDPNLPPVRPLPGSEPQGFRSRRSDE